MKEPQKSTKDARFQSSQISQEIFGNCAGRFMVFVAVSWSSTLAHQPTNTETHSCLTKPLLGAFFPFESKNGRGIFVGQWKKEMAF